MWRCFVWNILVAQKINIDFNKPSIAMVREKGLEPPRLTALEPKSSASTNFATLAFFQAFNYSAFIKVVAYFFTDLRRRGSIVRKFRLKIRPQNDVVAA